MIEYEVIILDPDPDQAAVGLNGLAAMGWRVAGVYAEDRIILEREAPVLTGPKTASSIRVIDQPPIVA